MAPVTKEKGTLVTGVIGNDVHISGIRILEYALQKAGFKIVSLGAMTPAEDFINAAIETKANVILVSSLNGHAKICCEGFRDKCIEAGLKDIIIYLGGYLVVGTTAWDEAEKKFKAMGIDRVYPPATSPSLAIEHLEADIATRRRK